VSLQKCLLDKNHFLYLNVATVWLMMLYSARELELEDRQSRLEAQLRERIASEGNRQPAGKLFDL